MRRNCITSTKNTLPDEKILDVFTTFIIIADSVVDLLKLKLESKLKFSKKLYITR